MGNVTSVLMGVSSLLAGARWLKEGLTPKSKAKASSLQAVSVATPSCKGGGMRHTTYTVNTIEDRIRHIVGLIQKGRDDPRVRKLTAQLLSKKCGDEWCTPEKNAKAEVETIFAAVRQHVRYTRDTYGKDLYQHPMRTLEFGAADCDDFAIVLSSMIQSVGFPVKLRVIRTKGAADWNHIYVLVGLPARAPKKWFPLDASVDKGPWWQAPKSMVAAHRDFLVP